MVARAFGSVILILLVVGLPGAAGQDGLPQGSVDVLFRLGSDFVGTAAGTCDATYAELPRSTGEVTISTEGGQLVAEDVEFNTTRVNSTQGNVVAYTDGWIQRSEHSIGAGQIRLSWASGGRVQVYGSDERDPSTTPLFAAAFTGDRVAVSKVTGSTLTNVKYAEAPPLGVVPAFMGVGGPNRLVAIAGGQLTLDGPMELFLEQATLVAPGGATIALPARHEVVQRAHYPGGFELDQDREHYAILRLDNARLEVPTDRVTLYCHGLTAQLDGTLNAYDTRGRLDIGGETIDFEERELRLVGAFRWTEDPGEGGVSAQGAGAFESALLDFEPVAGGESWSEGLAEIGFWAVLLAAILAALYWLGKIGFGFFSRLRESDVVGHPSRQLVLESVKANPNVTLIGLTRATGLSQSEVRYHARILEARNLLRSHKVHRDRCYVARETIRREGAALLTPSTELVARNDPVVGALLRAVPIEGTRLNPLLLNVMNEMRISRPGAWKAVQRAEKWGLVRCERMGREVWVRCA